MQGIGNVGGQGLLKKLTQAGLVPAFQADAVTYHAQEHRVRIEDALVETGAVTEEAMLKYLANLYETRFVSTEKLSKARGDAAALALMPEAAARKMCVFPVMMHKRTHTLTVVCGDSDNFANIKQQLKLVCQVPKIRVFVSRPASITAAINKHYSGKRNAFANVMQFSNRPGGNFGNDFGIDMGRGGMTSRKPGPMSQQPIPIPKASTGSFAQPAPPPPGPPDTPFQIQDDALVAGLAAAKPTGLTADMPPTPQGGLPPVPTGHALPQPNNPAAMPPTTTGQFPALESIPPQPPSRYNAATLLKVIGVMTSVFEQDRGELAGHSNRVGKLAETLAREAGASDDDATAIGVAGYFHDIGKSSSYHLTALNVAQYEGHATQARQTFMTAPRLLESCDLPNCAAETLKQLYERFDGNGFPSGLRAKEITLGARIVGLVETYIDITTNSKNPFREVLTPENAFTKLEPLCGTIFDPDLFQMLKRHMLESGRAQDGHSLLLVEPNPDEATVLTLRLQDAGCRVRIVRSATEAVQAIAEELPDLLLTEVTLEGPHNGFQLAEKVKEKRPGMPIIFLTERGDDASVSRGFDLGATDYLVKPTPAGVISSKIGQALRAKNASRGLSGTLGEMGLPDVVQILVNGRKSGKLSIQGAGSSGEIHFLKGKIVQAQLGTVIGEEAFYKLFSLTEGTFALDPGFVPTDTTINAPSESLLLEAMRRQDEH